MRFYGHHFSVLPSTIHVLVSQLPTRLMAVILVFPLCYRKCNHALVHKRIFIKSDVALAVFTCLSVCLFNIFLIFNFIF
jgi:hypothetical protein